MNLPVFPRVKPVDLSGVENGQLPGHLLVTVEMPGSDARCHPQFARALRALIHDCRQATGVELANVGHYRPLDRQIALLKERYVRAESGTRFWDGSWWRRVSGAAVATPGTSDHGWGLAIDGAIWDPGAGRVVAVYKSKAWSWIREHLTDYGLCWAWDDESEEPWHWHLHEIGARAVVAFEGGADGRAFDPARRLYAEFPTNRNKETLRVGSTGEAVRYLQGVCRNEVARFAAWFFVQEPDRLPDGRANHRKLYLRSAADGCSKVRINGHYDESMARTITLVQHAFSNSSFGGRRVGRLAADGRVGRQQTWPFIDTLADGKWAA